jgi:murein DD-endopeptidase MepM/ murein hydrolase activator NlpD
VTLIERSLIAVFLAAALALSWGAPTGGPGGSAQAGADPLLGGSGPIGHGPIPGSYAWPVVGPVIRGFIAPPNHYGAGHRGIDIGVAFGSPVHAANDGVVAFAGWVGGSLYVSIDHLDGVRTTYSWLSLAMVRKGESVRRGDVIASSGHGHPEIQEPHLHFGARIGETYIDPMILLEGGDVRGLIRLAPIEGSRR